MLKYRNRLGGLLWVAKALSLKILLILLSGCDDGSQSNAEDIADFESMNSTQSSQEDMTSGVESSGGEHNQSGENSTRDGEGGTDAIHQMSPPGHVTFVPIYEPGSAWESNMAAQQMVEQVFTDFASMIRTSGPWNATIEVFLNCPLNLS